MSGDQTGTSTEPTAGQTPKPAAQATEDQPMNNPMFAKLGGRRRRRGSSVIVFIVVAGIVAIIAAIGVYFLTR